MQLHFKKASMFFVVMFKIRCRASLLIHTLCGVMVHFFAECKGLVSSGGSVDTKSNAPTAIELLVGASARCCSLINCPRGVLIRHADGFINCSISLLTNC